MQRSVTQSLAQAHFLAKREHIAHVFCVHGNVIVIDTGRNFAHTQYAICVSAGLLVYGLNESL